MICKLETPFQKELLSPFFVTRGYLEYVTYVADLKYSDFLGIWTEQFPLRDQDIVAYGPIVDFQTFYERCLELW